MMNENATLLNQNGMNIDSLPNDPLSEENAIQSSWDRCRDVGLSPSGKPIDAVTSDTDLSIIQEKTNRSANLFYQSFNCYIIK